MRHALNPSRLLCLLLSGLLTVSEEEALLDGKELTLPPFGIAILTGGGD